MKNRRMLIAVFMCFAMLFVGIGYAQLVGHLTIRGASSYNKEAAEDGFTENLVFSNPEIIGGGSAAMEGVADDATASEQEATFTVRTLAVQNERVSFQYTLTNGNTVDVEVTMEALHEDGSANPSPLPEPNFYKVESVVVDTETMVEDHERVEAATCMISAGDSVTVTVTVVMIDTPETEVIPENFYMHLTATSVDAAVNAG